MMRKFLMLLLLLPLVATAAPYNRNEARTVNKIVFGDVDSVRYISNQEVINSQRNGWGNSARRCGRGIDR